MLTIDITINGRTIHKYLVCRSEAPLQDDAYNYSIHDNDGRHLGEVAHSQADKALTLSLKVLGLIKSKYGVDG
jgi:hypothetical protein